jgi:hypothetical protein
MKKESHMRLSDKRNSTRYKSILLIIINIILAVSLSGQIYPSIEDIAKKPELPFEATTFEQDDLVDIIQSNYKYDGFAEEDLSDMTVYEACDKLMEDDSAPFVLRAWAVRYKLYRYHNWPEESLETARNWLDKYEGQDPNPIEVSYMALRSVARSGYLTGLPYYEDVRTVFDDFFSHYLPDNMYTAEAHLDYAHLLDRFSIMNVEYYKKVIEQLGEAVAIMEWLLQNKEYSEEERNALEKKIDKYKQEYEKRLSDGIPAESYLDEGEYRETQQNTNEKLKIFLQEEGIDPKQFGSAVSRVISSDESNIAATGESVQNVENSLDGEEAIEIINQEQEQILHENNDGEN